MTSDLEDCVGEELEICPLCLCIGLPERVRPENHRCSFFDDAE